MARGRSGRPWQRLSAQLRAELPPICAWCGGIIDRTLPATHKKSWTLDHISPIADHEVDPEDPTNLRPMHRDCNSKRSRAEQMARKYPPKNSRVWG